MAEQNQKSQAAPVAPVKSDGFGPRIAAKCLHFDHERMMPGGHMGSTLEDKGLHLSQKRYRIDYLPQMGCYEVRWYAANSEEPSDIRYVPRDWASFTLK